MLRPRRGQNVLDDGLRAIASATTLEQLRQAQYAQHTATFFADHFLRGAPSVAHTTSFDGTSV